MRTGPTLRDWAIALTGTALTEWVVWTGTLGTHVAGPRWLTACWPLLLDLPLAWRRIAPLPSWLCVVLGFALHPLLTGNSAEGIELLYPIGIGAYAVAAYASRRRAVAGLVAFIPAYLVHSFNDTGVRHNQRGGQWASAFFGVAAVGVWLLGIWMRYRRDAAVLAARAVAAERDAAAAVADERARMARELHDIVSHNLSVVVLQAAGARAGGGGQGTLEKIERSGREALVEMRRLLGVLRDDDADEAFVPQPGTAQLSRLADDVCEAGVPVRLHVDDGCDGLPPALQLTVYRIVQEALTNVLRHAEATRAEARVAVEETRVVVRVSDDGRGSDGSGAGGGHGLVGMRERVALFDGELRAGPQAAGGFAIEAILPLAP